MLKNRARVTRNRLVKHKEHGLPGMNGGWDRQDRLVLRWICMWQEYIWDMECNV